MKTTKVKKCDSLEVGSVTLLSASEYETYQSIIPKIRFCWWLRSAGSTWHTFAVVCPDGGIDRFGVPINSCSYVRPAFKLNNCIHRAGEKVYVGSLICTALNEKYVLSDYAFDILPYAVDKYSHNDWSTSTLRKYLQSSQFKEYIGLT